jgi:carboxymethylenebutenolidase
MKKTLIGALLIATTLWGCTQSQAPEKQETTMLCHDPSATESFATLGDDKSFVNAHEEPLKMSPRADMGKMITFKTPDGKEGKAYFIEAKKKSKNYLFVIHEWWGLNDYIKSESEKLYGQLENVNVVALDMYDGKVTDKREEAAQFMQGVQKDRAEAIVKGAVEFAGKKAKIFTVGWCFGGGWSLQSSILAGKQAAGCVIYYGMPEKDVNRLKTLKADVLGIFASQEQWISTVVVKEFEENMKKAGKKITVKSYDAEHAFANPSNPKYNKEFAEDANKLTVEFFKARM